MRRFVTWDNFWLGGDVLPLINWSLFSSERGSGMSIVIFGFGMNLGIQI